MIFIWLCFCFSSSIPFVIIWVFHVSKSSIHYQVQVEFDIDKTWIFFSLKYSIIQNLGDHPKWVSLFGCFCNMLNGFRGKSGRNGRWPMSPWCDVCENFMTKLFPTFLQCSWYLRYLVPGVMFVKTLWQNQQTCFLPLKFQNVHQRMEASNIFYYMQWYLVPGVMLVKLLKKPADLFLPLKRSSTFKISTGIKPLEICYNFCFLLGTVRQCVCFPLYVQSYWSNWN